MVLNVIRVLLIAIAAGAFATLVNHSQSTQTETFISRNPGWSFIILMAITISFVVGDMLIRRKRVEDISAIYFGLLIGVLLSYLFMLAVAPIFKQSIFEQKGYDYENALRILSLLILPYLCIAFLLQTKNDFRFIIPYVEFSRELKGGRPLVLDSTALIDGRIADLVETHLIDSQLVIPGFVLQDLQEIADSGDKIRKSRGRRGLDILGKLQQSPRAEVRIHNTPHITLSSSSSKDQLIIEICKELSGRVITNDVNLNKVASVQNVDVVNLNDVANALKPRFLPGEQIRIRIIKEGESTGQGVGYLDDGTMVVCEQGSGSVGKEIDVEVTSVLQNSAGRMIFSKLPGQPATGSGKHSHASQRN